MYGVAEIKRSRAWDPDTVVGPRRYHLTTLRYDISRVRGRDHTADHEPLARYYDIIRITRDPNNLVSSAIFSNVCASFNGLIV